MGILGNLTGGTVARNAETFRSEMEGVYGAVATRITELLDRAKRQEERLEAAERQIEGLRKGASVPRSGWEEPAIGLPGAHTVSGRSLAWIVALAASAGGGVAWLLTTVLT